MNALQMLKSTQSFQPGGYTVARLQIKAISHPQED